MKEIRSVKDYVKTRNHVRSVDLHGYHIHQGYRIFNETISNAYFNEQKKIVVITGQGMMMRELPVWCRNNSYVRDYTQHKHNPGSFIIKLKKRNLK